MKQGDLVFRNSYGADVLFKIEALRQEQAVLKGIEYRLLADAPLTDLLQAQEQGARREYELSRVKMKETLRDVSDYRALQLEKTRTEQHYFELPGKVLHLDGDPLYLRKSMDLYEEMRVPAVGHHVNERDMAALLYRILPVVRPDIVVVTGHDGLLKHRKNDKNNLDSYKNSLNFVKAVQIARQYERGRDTMTIIAGACQSYFEALLQAGANFASSPARILIHALDPVQIAAKVAFTSIRETINVYDVISQTISGMDGVGGIESRGSYRIGLPRQI